MSKKILIIIGVVIVLGLAGYFIFNKNKVNNPASHDNKLADDSAMAEQKSLKDLMNQAKPVRCDFTSEGMTSRFYIADNQMRSDSSSIVDGKEMITHMIILDNTSYTWIEGSTTGFKVTGDENEVATNNDLEDGEAAQIDLDQKASYSCSGWLKNGSVFALPANVTFTDLNALVPPDTTSTNNSGAKANDDSLKAMQCAACDSAPAESRAQCKATLNCN